MIEVVEAWDEHGISMGQEEVRASERSASILPANPERGHPARRPFKSGLKGRAPNRALKGSESNGHQIRGETNEHKNRYFLAWGLSPHAE